MKVVILVALATLSAVAAPLRAKAIAATDLRTCAITRDDELRCWGRTIGDSQPSPTAVPGLGKVRAVAIARLYACALTAEGVQCWGLDPRFDVEHAPVPLGKVSGLPGDVVALAVSERLACAATPRSVWCWGHNSDGELGQGDDGERDRPVEVPHIDDVAGIAVGDDHACVVDRAGAVQCWGRNDDGQLGAGSKHGEESRPVKVMGLPPIAAIVAQGDHTCALARDGGVWCWGANIAGELGDASAKTRDVPVRIAGVTAKAIATGRAHVCALHGDSTVTCWGAGEEGQLGDRGTQNRVRPVAMREVKATAVAAGSSHTCVLARDGSVHCVGNNAYGQLGSGKLVNGPVLVPVEVE